MAASTFPVRTSSRACALVSVVDGGEGLDIDGDGLEGFTDLDGLRTVVVVHNSHAGANNFSAECIAQDDKLNQGQHQET